MNECAGSLPVRCFPHGHSKPEKLSPRVLGFFVLFSGISTASNLSRHPPRPGAEPGLFLFRKTKGK